MAHFVYILYSPTNDIYYKGESNDPFARLEYHNKGMSEYTRGKGPWVLVYYCEFPDKSSALKREKELKKLNRRSTLKLINDVSNKMKA